MKIFGLDEYLGDTWHGVNYLLRIGKPFKISSQVNYRYIERFHQIIELLDGPLVEFEFVDLPATNLLPHCRNEKVEYYPTKLKWKPPNEIGIHKRICYRFIGNWGREAKNTPELEKDILSSFIDGVEFIDLSAELSLKECVEIAANSDAYIGNTTGITHICHSVGVPIFLINYSFDFKHLESCHIGKNYKLCIGPYTTMWEVSEYIKSIYKDQNIDSGGCKNTPQNTGQRTIC